MSNLEDLTRPTDLTLTEAFQSLLRVLCITEFPCGEGSWRSSKKWRSETPDIIDHDESQDGNAQFESIESLKELANTETFRVNTDWSIDTTALRDLAIENPAKLTRKGIYQFLTKLRIVNKNVSKVDEGLLKFENLKELVLSANQLSSINPANLPNNLEVLELCGNKIEEISSFGRNQSSLTHLGIGHNRLISIVDKIKPNSWNQLLSLDMCCNNITDLKATIETLRVLPKLRNLLLSGNPIYLAVVYRGYVIDSLKQLSILDDIRVSADEKDRFKGISKLKGLPTDDALVMIKITTLKGLGKPDEYEIENVDDFPRIDFRYQIEYNFLRNAISKRSKPKDECKTDDGQPSATSQGDAKGEQDSKENLSDPEDELNASMLNTGDVLRELSTRERVWSEDGMLINYDKMFRTSDLTNLKTYLLDGVTLKIVENKVLVTNEPPLTSEETDIDQGPPGSKIEKTNKKKMSLKETKGTPVPKDTEGKAKVKGRAKGRGRNEDNDLYEISRERKAIAQTSVDLKSLLQENDHLEKDCTFTTIAKVSSLRGMHGEESRENKLNDSMCGSSKNVLIGDSKKKGKDKPSCTSALPSRRSVLGKSSKVEKNIKVKESSKQLADISEKAKHEPVLPKTVDLSMSFFRIKTAKEAQAWIIDNGYVE